MKTEIRDQGTGISAAEETLRLLARLNAPDGLEKRVQKSLRVAAIPAARKARILSWPAGLRPSGGWMQAAPVRAAAAAAIAAVVVGGGWIVSSRLPASQPATALALPAQTGARQGFSSSGAMRTPQTLDRPVVEAIIEAPPERITPQTKGKAGLPVAQTALRHGKSASAKKIPTQPVGANTDAAQRK
jgi:hypothetical protein